MLRIARIFADDEPIKKWLFHTRILDSNRSVLICSICFIRVPFLRSAIRAHSMTRAIPITFLFAAALIASLAMLEPPATAADSPAKVLRHVVMYQFKDTATAEQVQQVVEAFNGLPKKIDAIIGYEAGTNVSPEGKSEGFTHVFVVTFKDEAGRDAYLKHPAHDAYVQVVKDKREKVIVFDYWAAKH